MRVHDACIFVLSTRPNGTRRRSERSPLNFGTKSHITEIRRFIIVVGFVIVLFIGNRTALSPFGGDYSHVARRSIMFVSNSPCVIWALMRYTRFCVVFDRDEPIKTKSHSRRMCGPYMKAHGCFGQRLKDEYCRPRSVGEQFSSELEKLLDI